MEIGRRIGVVGSGFVARHFVMELLRRGDWALGAVLTRRPLERVAGFPEDCLTSSPDALIEASDIVLECSGDVPWATRLAPLVLAAGRPLVTLDSEFHVTTGSAFVERGYMTEAEGDQPGSIAALAEAAHVMGFEPLVFGNMKAFLDHHPTPETMRHWAERQGISLPMVISFTDGTKLQVEQCLVGNFFGADIACEGLSGVRVRDPQEAGRRLAAVAVERGVALTDYLLAPGVPHGVFVTGRHDPAQAAALRHLKLGDGPFYTLEQPWALVHLEAFRTLERVWRGQPPLLHNTARPHLSVAAVAKRRLKAEERIERGSGSFELRGVCVRIADRSDHLPIGLANRLTIRRTVEPGQVLTMDDVSLEDGPEIDLWRRIAETATAGVQRNATIAR